MGLVVIRGPLGSGKTTVAKMLCEQLQGYYVSVDDLVAQLGEDRVEVDDEGISASSFVRALERCMSEIQTRLKNRQTVILDGAFYHREPLDYLKEKTNYPIRVFTLKVPVELCIARDQNRPNPHGEDSARAVHMMVSRFDEGTIIDGTGTATETQQQILQQLQALP